MVGTTSGIWNQAANVATSSPNSARSYAAGSPRDEADSGESANISANDFLTLLVTEMKNQDPTADTDPIEYINQLVQVNSLEQLISINQTLTADSVAPSAHKVSLVGKTPETARASGEPHVPGNLTVPSSNAAAQRVAEALGGRVTRK
jgi:flagellar basal-body rod modification protein FlgD